MPRLRLFPLKKYSFTMGLTVRTTDMNYGGHLGNDRLLALLHEARVAFLKHHNMSELDCGGVSLIMGDAALVFKNEAFAGDALQIHVEAAEPSKKGFRIFYKVNRISDDAVIALAETGMATYNYTNGKLAPLPTVVQTLCNKSASTNP